MITDSSSFTKNQVASRPAPAETTGPDLSDEVIDPNEKHLGTDHLLSDLKGCTISGAVHAHVLPTGKVIWWSSVSYGDYPTLWDPSANTNTAAPQAGENNFCSGHSFLSNGQLFVAGGHVTNYVGIPNARTYNPFNNTWTQLPNMNNGRWYPTNTTLPNGDMLVVAGEIDPTQGMDPEPQVWQTATASWRNLSTAAPPSAPRLRFLFRLCRACRPDGLFDRRMFRRYRRARDLFK
jgi:Glyoxal oxidase N-terminus